MASDPLANTFTHLTSPAAGQSGGQYISWEHFDLPTTITSAGLEIPWFPKGKMDRLEHLQITNNGMWQS